VFWALLLILYGVSGSVFAVLGCTSMLFSVKLQHSLREVWMLQVSVATTVNGCAE
jgi:hypothetical protein